MILAATVIYIALRANFQRANAPIEGSNPQQQQNADQLRAILARDSTDVDANIGLANVLFDTSNWPEAIQHYNTAIRRDSSRVQAIVDLGVCYYNSGEAKRAEDLFHLALRRDPHQPTALFNLGIVAERDKRYDEALSFFHRALQSAPPEEMRPAIIEAMQRAQQATGRKPPPLPEGR